MITTYLRAADGRTAPSDAPSALNDPSLVWVDLFQPTQAEEEQVERAFGIDAPTALERSALEESARFYEEEGALFLTATLMGRRTEGAFVADAVTFILVQERLITVRTISPRAFDIGPSRASARIEMGADGAGVLMALLEGVVERAADILQETAGDIMALSTQVFSGRDPGPAMQAHLRTLGKAGQLTAMCHNSLTSLQRLVSFSGEVCTRHGLVKEKLLALRRDIEQLERSAEAQQDQFAFLLNALLGVVAAGQNNSLKALSIATVLFVPPTLIASIFGMNFEFMSWFKEPWGPWVGFALMLAAPAALFFFARSRKWF